MTGGGVGAPEQLMLWAQVITGLEVDEPRTVRGLYAPTGGACAEPARQQAGSATLVKIAHFDTI